jgi:hypothetical protein
MEDLATDWLEVQAHIPGFPDLPRLNQTNSSDRPAYATAYDRETAEIACKRFRTDIDLLGYADQVRVYVDSLPG